eukprot:CAMPEP_0175197822 /NCGR_PEP_ID=MMETSP0093-20121207/8213_1 /TAXON_ID=311494 /ORGANISM="Alexandrium monilatum, Strain CCMP3105" /LENGTH=49 /DNA_ID= /DNA_START= /DNA_END= /DNA_ORIENTATION=
MKPPKPRVPTSSASLEATLPDTHAGRKYVMGGLQSHCRARADVAMRAQL